ncbi:MAG: DEAD/DEAH box helicase family protein [Kiritimatiellae bacterium]|nr:DEAD/DEAH box helicase family protein [Kiritimatiellia bacterium]
MSNFTPFFLFPPFRPFARQALAAERLLAADPAGCVAGCRDALEGAVRWMHAADEALADAWGNTLESLAGGTEFREIAGSDLLRRIGYIRKTAEAAGRGRKKPGKEEALLCLENLHAFLDFLAFCYADRYEPAAFDRAAAETPPEAELPAAGALPPPEAAQRAAWTARRKARRARYAPKPLAVSEYATRKLYIDAMLEDAGWVEGQDWLDEYELHGLPTPSGTGYADYVLLGNDGRVLAVLEAKRTCRDVAAGRQQAQVYADAIARRQGGLRPLVFLSNGFETRFDDHRHPERKVASVHSRRDLEKWFNLERTRQPLDGGIPDKAIAGRYYQEAAVKAVCDAFDARNRRKALLVMATGSGKTRTVISLCKVLLERGWVRNILFLADRNALVTQAKRAFAALLPELSATNLCEEKDNPGAHAVFSTYQTMAGCIDAVREDGEKLFSCGHFDLVVCDEAHRSIYNKYRDIFSWFDAPLVGLTATPKDEIDKNTYAEFELQNGVPTYAYDLAQAVKDGYLVDFLSVEAPLKFVRDGIVYDELSEEDRQAYEETFRGGDGTLPPSMAPTALNEWIFNADTIRKALRILVEHGLRIDYGGKLGKTIVFAQSHRHAEKILEVFGREYPALAGQAKVIDNSTDYAQTAIDEFSDPNRLPQIAISVDMLDTGIDVPEVLNLVFFKRVMSKAKFWQMIGRGTRLCPGLLDGRDKERFLIFDFCGNFEFFRMSKGKPAAAGLPLQGALFFLKAQLAFQLQGAEWQTPPLRAFRERLVADLVAGARRLDRGNFAVRQHLEWVERCSDPAGFAALSYGDTLSIRDEVAPLVEPEADDPKALRFDALLHGIELAILAGKKHPRGLRDLRCKAAALRQLGTIPAVMERDGLLGRILAPGWLERADVPAFEEIREKLRGLIKFLPADRTVYETDFDDEILSMDWTESELETGGLENYKARAEHYLKTHLDHPAVAKLKGNVPLNAADVEALEKILWNEIGTRRDYEEACGKKPLGEFVREIVGLDMKAAKEAFAEFLDEARLDSRQIYFVNQIVEYIVRNGMMKDLSVLRDPPFTDRGSVPELFANVALWENIRRTIERINGNALTA